MNEVSIRIRVISIRSRGAQGGAIFAGRTEAGEAFVAVCHRNLLPDATLVDKGQTWDITGTKSNREFFSESGFAIRETQVAATSAQLVRPTGRHIVAWIAESSDTLGIGRVKAQRLYDRFGPDLVRLIEEKDAATLQQVINQEAAAQLCRAFEKHAVAHTLLWLNQIEMPRRIGASVLAFYKDEAQERITANPYVLLSFTAEWKVVDDFACNRLGIAKHDPRRLLAAIEQALYQGLGEGHTCLPRGEVETRVLRLLGSDDLTDQSIAAASNGKQFMEIEGCFQLNGCQVIERYIAGRLREILAGEDRTGQKGLFSDVARNCSGVEKAINAFEGDCGVSLTPEQRAAVRTCLASNLSLILGGAGTGKTTVLKALFAVLQNIEPGTKVFQLALAGLAAKRMTEATGLESITIAGFLARVDSRVIEIGSLIVVDEASMVDVILLYRLQRHIPSWVRFIFLGDPSQLPPIGPGLVLHALVGLPCIPQTELKTVVRQTAQSGIPRVAAAIRAHQIPDWAAYSGTPSSGVAFVPCTQSKLVETIQKVYVELGGTGSDFNVQILSITNARLSGVRHLNRVLHGHFQAGAERINRADPDCGVTPARALDGLEFCVGDLVMFTENDYVLGLRNGSLGTILAALDVACCDDPCCVAKFDGTEYMLGSRQMNSLVHAYSITVHKSQGSEFPRVIIPISESRLLDQSLIYTAVTRGVQQVVLIGDERALCDAIRRPAIATRRYTTLRGLLLQEVPHQPLIRR